MLKVVCAIIEVEGRVLCTRRGPGMANAGLWEFPGGKIEAAEEAAEAIFREIKEELGLEVEVLEIGPGFVSPLSDGRQIELIPCICKSASTDLVLTEHDAFIWLPLNQLSELNWSKPDLPIIDWLLAR